ncbi:hypothetical protein C479_04757 [Halovivax asiaticus JCM 14624]|uniref:Uncharacterized protein n=1 Tax=Halovivax asiaticus JCM 14624 TaxID=1227490 RepID=M0BQM5_9EURY|nr:hypothetical protein [Halovivax asiaticus]ELZ12678.1 hypothetical protein C479_04757 [Halovivax asiaticus JCM 14624]
MTVTNGHGQHDTCEESFDGSGADALDALLEALRADQGGARTEALKRAIEHRPEPDDTQDHRRSDLAAAVQQLETDVQTLAESTDDAESGTVRAELDAAADERETLRAAVDELRTTTDVQDRIETIEGGLSDLAERQAALETATRELRSDLDADVTTDTQPAADSDASPSEPPRDQSDVIERIDHVERILDTRTTALASKARRIETVEARLDDLEASLDERTNALENDLDAVNETLEEAATMLQSETRAELESVRTELEERIDALESEFETAVDSLESDVDTLEWHAVDMIQWRKSYEESVPDTEGDDGRNST